MKNIIENNAYGILGLLPNASQKEITKRVKEIERFLQIGEVPEYDFDFNIYNKKRNKETIKNAFHDISTVESQILHYYFRIYANTERQVAILKTIDNDYDVSKIIEYYDKLKTKPFITKKNIAIISTMLLPNIKSEGDDFIKAVDFSMKLWLDVTSSDKSIKDFIKIFSLDDEIGISENIYENLSERINNELLSIFSDISMRCNNEFIIAKFIKSFGLENSTLNIELVDKIYETINFSLKELTAMNISEDGIFDNDEKYTLKKCLEAFQDNFNKLVKLGLYNNEKTIILRDVVATKIRIHILDLFNNLDEDETALKLMKFAIYIVGTDGLKAKLNNELNQMNDVIFKGNVINQFLTDKNIILEEIENKATRGFKFDIEIAELKEKGLAFCQNDKIDIKTRRNIADQLALEIRAIAIDLHNNKERFKEALCLLDFSIIFAITEETKNLILKDIPVVNETVEKRCGISGILHQCSGCLSYFIGWGIIMFICWIISLFD